jgi:hypothetical protein
MDITREQLSIGSAVVVVVGIFIASFLHITTFVGTNDNREFLKGKLNKATYLALGGTAAAVIAALAFYWIKPESIMYLLLFVVFMGFGLAWAACAIALIKRK